MTYEELIELARSGDPLFDPEFPECVSITPEGLLIRGSYDDVQCCDLLIRIEDNGFRVWARDPEEWPKEVAFHGREWTAETFFHDYDDLVTWAYTW